MSWKKATWSGVALAAVLSWPAIGAAEVGGGITGPELVRVLQDAGYKAKLDKDSDGDPRIETSMSGAKVFVSFYDCKQDRCGSLQFVVAMDLKDGSTWEAMNRFNSEYRYGRAHLDEEMDPFLRFDFEVLHTARTEHIVSQIDIWEDVLNAFLKATRNGGGGDAGEDTAA
jgi:hypothetical protein